MTTENFPLPSRNLPDPDIARQRYHDLETLLGSRERQVLSGSVPLRRALLHALSLSPFIFQTLTRHPDFIQKLDTTRFMNPPGKRTLASTIGRSLKRCETREEASRVLRIFRLFHTVRIALRELAGVGTVQDTMREMSILADVVMSASLKYETDRFDRRYGPPMIFKGNRRVRSHCAVIHLGKLGGEELNFSSDIDILYVFDSEKGETHPASSQTPLPNAEYYRRLAEQVTRLVSEKTSEGFAFRVDLGLRPDGQYGDIANSLRSMEIYYESWGKLWERAVWIKARHGAGHTPLSVSLLKTLHPFVYRKYLDFTAIEEIREMKLKMDQKNRLNRKGRDDIKLGWGGIREIEFFVQALQLIHGGKNPHVQCRNTLEALRRLGESGLVAPSDVETLREAYLFLRCLEHRIQLVHQRQTQCLPSRDEEQLRIARSLGFTGQGLAPLRALRTSLDHHREKVHTLYDRLFHTPTRRLVTGVSRDIQALFSEDIPPDHALQWLEENGFRAPQRAFDIIRRLREGPPSAHYIPKTLNRLNRLLPSLIQAVITSPDPDMALGYLLSFVEKIGARGTFYSLLLENPPVLKLLVKMFGSSRFLSTHLIHHPELLDELIHPTHSGPKKSQKTREIELENLLGQLSDDLESKMDGLRRYKHAEVLKIGISDIYGDMEITAVTAQLSLLAEACLTAAYQVALRFQLQKYHLPLTLRPPFVILGMGKLGGRELNYSSDLDLIFLFDAANHAGLPRRIDPNEFYGKLAQRFITVMSAPTIEGSLYEIDTRLRPSGTFGPIVTSLHSFETYHQRSAWFWERQALIKARPIAGDPLVFRTVERILDQIVYGSPLTDKEQQEILNMREQMEKEIAKESPTRYHIKCGRGGLVDIEFLIQYYQLKTGGERPEVRQPNTLNALNSLETFHLIPASLCHTIQRNYLFLRKLENRIQILENRSSPFLNPAGPEMPPLARRMGYRSRRGHPAAAQLLEDYLRITDENRKLFRTYVYPSSLTSS